MKRERMVVVQITVFETLKDVSFKSTWFQFYARKFKLVMALKIKSSSVIMEFWRENSNCKIF